MKDLETDLQKAFKKVLAKKHPDFDSLNDIAIQEIEIEDLNLDIPIIEFE